MWSYPRPTADKRQNRCRYESNRRIIPPWSARIADICSTLLSLLAARRNPFRSIVDAMPMIYFGTSAGALMICCWRRIMLWLGIGMMAFNWFQVQYGVKRERERRISRSCFPTRLYGYLAPPSTRYGDTKTWRKQHGEFEKYCILYASSYCSECTSRLRLSAVCSIGMGKKSSSATLHLLLPTTTVTVL